MELIHRLESEFNTRVSKNPQYSMRSFARSLKIDSSTLSALLRGKRPLSLKTAQKILNELDWSPIDKRLLLLKSFGADHAEKPVQYEMISEKTLEVISGWEHFAIMSFLDTKTTDRSVRGIASALNLGTGVTMAALKRLEALGLTESLKSGWRVTGKNLTTSSDIPSAALRRAHVQYIEKALYSLEHHDISERDISGVTMGISKKRLPEAKKMIQEFRRNLTSLLEAGDRTDVYRLNVQLFPLKK